MWILGVNWAGLSRGHFFLKLNLQHIFSCR
jgi:hypothetical protein